MVIPVPNKRQTLLVLAVMGFLALCFAAGPAQAFPQLPSVFWGPVTVGDNPAPDGLQVVAKLNVWEGSGGRLETFSSATTSQGNYGVEERMAIQGDDPATPEKEGASEGELIFFFLVTPEGELPAEQEPPVFRVGGVNRLPLHFPKEASGSAPAPQSPQPSAGDIGSAIPETGEGSTGGVLVSNFTDSDQELLLTLVLGDQVVQQQPVLVPSNAEVGVEFETPTSDVTNYQVRSSGAPGSLVAFPPGTSQLFFDNLRVTPLKVANGKEAEITVNVNNPGVVPVHRRVFLRIGVDPIDPPRNVVVEPGDVQILRFAYTPQGVKLGPVQVRIGNAAGVLSVIDPVPWRLYLPLLILGPVLVVAAAAWLYLLARRGGLQPVPV